MKTLLNFILCFYGAFTSIAQQSALQTLRIKTNVVVFSEDVEEGHSIKNDSSGIDISTFKFYISNVKLLNAKKNIYTENISFHLIDFSDTSTCVLHFDNAHLKKAKYLQFYLGIDSLTNVSGAMGGDLDPIHGMYWTWQSGYINIKLEGSYTSASGTVKKFEYHLGGYNAPYASMQVITLPIKKNTDPTLLFDLKSILPLLLNSGSTTVMSPGASAQRISHLLSKCFTLK